MLFLLNSWLPIREYIFAIFKYDNTSSHYMKTASEDFCSFLFLIISKKKYLLNARCIVNKTDIVPPSWVEGKKEKCQVL